MDLDELAPMEDPHQRPVGTHLDPSADQRAWDRVERPGDLDVVVAVHFGRRVDRGLIGIGRRWLSDPYGRSVNRSTILLSTANHVRPGSSGGAVVETSGDVIGIVFAGPRNGTGYALAIPSEDIALDVNRAGSQPVSASGCTGLR
jgi:S1-C subfamily serine protease